MEGKEIESKILEIESLICGLWYNPIKMTTWEFSKIEPKDREGTVLIADTSKPVRGMQLGYEVIWVSDEMVFIDLIYYSFIKRDQHQIWLTD